MEGEDWEKKKIMPFEARNWALTFVLLLLLLLFCFSRVVNPSTGWVGSKTIPFHFVRCGAVQVVSMQGWERGMRWGATGLPWVPSSPNLPTERSVALYIGTGLIEGVNLSEGRGTTLPFELIGAQWLDWRWANALRDPANTNALPGIHFREAYYTPVFSKFANQTCAGVQVRQHARSPEEKWELRGLSRSSLLSH